jgi:hypothetical protein
LPCSSIVTGSSSDFLPMFLPVACLARPGIAVHKFLHPKWRFAGKFQLV